MTEAERVADLCERLKTLAGNTGKMTHNRGCAVPASTVLRSTFAELKRLAARCDALEEALENARRRALNAARAALGSDPA